MEIGKMDFLSKKQTTILKFIMQTLNIFYQEPDPDRWFKYDRYIRKIIRKVVRGSQRPSGQQLVAINLLKGLKKIGISYRYNDFNYIKNHPQELACIIGKDNVLFERKWKNPIVFGAAFGINPIANPSILVDYPIKQILVPGKWVKDFFAPYGDENVSVWPVGIDTEEWKEQSILKKYDFLIYNKIRWDNEKLEHQLINPIKQILKKNNYSFTEIKYGSYEPLELKEKIGLSKFAIFICEHETQGIAYQQILASNLPILAWDRGGFWQDPHWYPHKTKFAPVSSVPYWHETCGLKFESANIFEEKLNEFIHLEKIDYFKPRNYILENLTLEKCAENYVKIVSKFIR